MIERLVEKLVNEQVERGIIDESQQVLYRYGYIVLVEILINVVLAFVVGVWSGRMFLVVLFNLIFIPLRSYCGGWHASKSWICMLFSTGTLILVVFLEQFSLLLIKLAFFMEMFSVVVILSFAPIDSDSKRLDEKERKLFQNIARFILILEVVALIMSRYFKCDTLSVSIICAHMLQSISLCVCVHKKNV